MPALEGDWAAELGTSQALAGPAFWHPSAKAAAVPDAWGASCRDCIPAALGHARLDLRRKGKSPKLPLAFPLAPLAPCPRVVPSDQARTPATPQL